MGQCARHLVSTVTDTKGSDKGFVDILPSVLWLCLCLWKALHWILTCGQDNPRTENRGGSFLCQDLDKWENNVPDAILCFNDDTQNVLMLKLIQLYIC